MRQASARSSSKGFETAAEQLWAQRSARFEAQVDGVAVAFTAEGRVVKGAGPALIDSDDDLAAGRPWARAGYTVAPLFSDRRLYGRLAAGIERKVRLLLEEAGAGLLGDFRLEDYHKFVAGKPELHRAVARRAQDMPYEEFPIDPEAVVERYSELCGRELSTHNPALDHDFFYIRIICPGAAVHPPHRDAYIDACRNLINSYVPIAGSDERSALAVIPGSHRWPESEVCRTASGSRLQGAPYLVPFITAARRGLKMTRPNPGPNEVMLFSPYLVHGAGVNFNPDKTRVSLQIMLCPRDAR